MPLPVSVQVITLNEEANIGDCIRAIKVNEPVEIVVIDGGSTDRTIEIARSHGARVITPGRLGRGASRHLGYTSTDQPYVAMVDADDRISPDWLETSLKELQEGNYAALQSCLRSVSRRTFWERGWDEYYRESIRPAVDTIMVGHPSVYRTDALMGTRDDIGNDHEDTQMSVDFQRRGLRQGIGTAVSYRVVPDLWAENSSKWLAYGRGYRSFVRRHPERKRSIARHMLITIPLVRGWRPLRRGSFESPLFCAIMAATIVRGFVKGPVPTALQPATGLHPLE